jgi:hypothetical protein
MGRWNALLGRLAPVVTLTAAVAMWAIGYNTSGHSFDQTMAGVLFAGGVFASSMILLMAAIEKATGESLEETVLNFAQASLVAVASVGFSTLTILYFQGEGGELFCAVFLILVFLSAKGKELVHWLMMLYPAIAYLSFLALVQRGPAVALTVFIYLMVLYVCLAHISWVEHDRRPRAT